MKRTHFITALLCCVDEARRNVPQHSQAHMSLREVLTLSLLFVRKARERALW